MQARFARMRYRLFGTFLLRRVLKRRTPCSAVLFLAATGAANRVPGDKATPRHLRADDQAPLVLRRAMRVREAAIPLLQGALTVRDEVSQQAKDHEHQQLQRRK